MEFSLKMYLCTLKTNILYYIEHSLSCLWFLSSPLAGKQDIVLQFLFGVCTCVSASVRPSGFVWTITCTTMHGFQNNLAKLLPLRRRCAIWNIFSRRLKVKVTGQIKVKMVIYMY